jgi:hypothetical protein
VVLVGCCGQRRAAFRRGAVSPRTRTPAPPETTTTYTTALRLRLVRPASASFRGAGTGSTYSFTASEPVQPIHQADVDSLLRTGLFQVVT